MRRRQNDINQKPKTRPMNTHILSTSYHTEKTNFTLHCWRSRALWASQGRISSLKIWLERYFTRYRYNWTFTIGSQIKPTHDEMVYAVEYHPDIWTQSSIVDLTERHSSIRLTPRCAHIVLVKIANVRKRSRLINILCGRSAVLLSYAVSFTGPTACPTAVIVAVGPG